MDFVAVIPKKVPGGASSIEVTVNCGIGRVVDVINRVQRKIHN